MDITIPYKEFIEQYFLRHRESVTLDKTDLLLPQLKLAQEKALVPLIYLQDLPAGEVVCDDFWSGEEAKDPKGKKLRRDKDLVRVWYKSDWDISYKKQSEASAAADKSRALYWERKELIDKLVPKVMKQTMLDESNARMVATSIVEKNNRVLLEQFLNG